MKWWFTSICLALHTCAIGLAGLPQFLIDHFEGDARAFRCPEYVQVGRTVAPKDVLDPLYVGVTWRTLKEQEEHLGPPFQDYRSKLAVPSRIFLSGDGHSIGGLQLARQGHQVTVSNLQDFYRARFARVADRPSLRHVHSIVTQQGAQNTFGQVAYEPVEVLNRLCLALDLRIDTIEPTQVEESYPNVDPPWKLATGVTTEQFFDSMVRFEQNVQRAIKALETSGNFSFQAKPTLDVLAKIPDGHFAMVVDLIGAFPSSLPRHTLLKELRRVLAPGAKGFVVDRGTDVVQLTRASSLALFEDWIRRHQGDQRVFLRDYLKKLSGGSFDYYTHEITALRDNQTRRLARGQKVTFDVIMVTGGTSATALDNLRLVSDDVMVSLGNGMHYPIGQYTEIPD